jgi:two-component system chemotaxis sensor kinase CheA
MDDLLQEFLTETNENLAVLDNQLVTLEQNPNDPALLSGIFRIVHTIKGTCGFLGLPRLESVAHAGENILGKFRDGIIPVTPQAVSLILESMDTIKRLLSVLEQTQKEPDGDDADLIARLNYFAENGAPAGEAPAAAAAPAPSDVVVPLNLPPVRAMTQEERDLEAAFAAAEAPADAPKNALPSPLEAPPAAAAAPPPPPKVEAPKPEIKAAAPPAAPKVQEPIGEAKESAVAGQSIRVNVDLLENLMTTISELVLTRNQLLQLMRVAGDTPFASPLQRLNQITSELQDGVMKTRMQPIGNAWSKLPRIVRDLSVELNKKMDLVMLGAETELDRQVLELIKDPLTHMVRNSADHGLEVPEDRARAGKPETGTITLNAFHEGGHIIIEIADDGKGLPMQKIKDKIVANGLGTAAEIAGMSEQQIQQYIFKAGFSTAAKVTSVSGRGVGMDVVRTNIEKIGGTIELSSTEGKGSRFIIKIPLTLAIVSAMIVEAGGERFAIPQLSIVELVRASANSEYQIEEINGSAVLRLRNRLLPLLFLRRILNLGEPEKGNESTYIVVTQVGNGTFGIVVDRVFDTEEIVVKPMSPVLRHLDLYSGNTILGDGSVIMILDPTGISTRAGEIQGGRKAEEAAAAQKKAQGEDTTTFMLFTTGEGSPKAVPLSLVARLEDVDMSKVEEAGGKYVIQYRGKLMPLLPINDNFTIPKEGNLPVLVFQDRERSMGLIVREILDIVEEKLQVDLEGKVGDNGTLGSAIISGKATDLIDAGYFLTRAFGDWFGKKEASISYLDAGSRRVLLVDDSAFFRNLLAPLLSVAGYDVTSAESGDEAIQLLENGARFDVIVSDIEMPGMNGFEFAVRLRANENWRNMPIIALTSHASPRDMDRSREAGFDDHVAKFDRDRLLTILAKTLTTSLKQTA